MKKLNEEDVKRIQIEILDVVSEFCDTNKIHYWLDSGTLLGAVRHKGYIPWDDDIDLGMLRPDYDRFVAEFNRSNMKYKLICIENTPDYYAAFGKVIDTDTVLYEPDRTGKKLAVNIDIFVYDNAPDDDKKVKRMYRIRDRLQFMALFSWGNQILKSDKFHKRLMKRFLHSICRLQSTETLIKKEIENSMKYSDIKTKRVGNFTSVSRIACSKAIFDFFIEMDFEGKKYKAPGGYDEWLRAFYGDYMQLPPEEKRVTHHQYEAYSIK